ncbi:hypothetical protein [Sphingobium nicotianae]|uniref:Uncharacterized protein n=1 Tax=Sphingobium nicotianae TaxID=2782607 RepID=A0A9X1DCF6_9SPHN|nr:hypothetical protein [Sphingobium nicotianae]MBT2187555.1 hypothetical protein [Sphingobium nicotianae]
MPIPEVQLDHAFAEALENNPGFRTWLISEGRFWRHPNAALLCTEQETARKSAKHWWKHWWTRLPDGSESETDIFSVWECDGFRFAIHIENKPPHGNLSFIQAATYRRRATFMANQPRWLSYSDFETIILAPSSFIERHRECANQFDRAITYEQIARFVPLMQAALDESEKD